MSDPSVAANHEEYMKYSKELGAIEPQYRAILAYEACEKEILRRFTPQDDKRYAKTGEGRETLPEGVGVTKTW